MNEQHKSHLPFVIIFQGRVGSTYLTEALDKHSEIVCWKEYFTTITDHLDLYERKKRNKKGPTQLEWLDNFYSSPPMSCSAVGFKTKLKDVLDMEGFSQPLIKHHAKIIHLQRRNKVKLTVSKINAVRLNEATGDWNLYNESQRPEQINIDFEQFDSWLKDCEKRANTEAAFLSKMNLPMINIYYEDLFKENTDSLNKIMNFLGVEFENVQGDALKTTSNDLKEAIENFDELAARYKGTTYEAMFYE